jgi:hypothetical protein
MPDLNVVKTDYGRREALASVRPDLRRAMTATVAFAQTATQPFLTIAARPRRSPRAVMGHPMISHDHHRRRT